MSQNDFATRDRLVSETAQSIDSMCVKIKEASIQCANGLKDGEWQVVNEVLLNVFDCCHWLANALRMIKKSYIDDNPSNENVQRWSEAQKEFARVLKEILDSFEKQDLPHLARLMEHDLVYTLDKWQDVIDPSINASNT